MLLLLGLLNSANWLRYVIYSEFGNERERGENRRRFLKLRRRLQIEQQLDGYIDWICAAGD